MYLFCLILAAYPMLLFGGIFDWFWQSSADKKLDFYCPYQCGEWGSDSIQKLEWKFVLCLYETQLIRYYIDKNYDKRCCDYSVKYSQDFSPVEFRYPLERPTNFDSKWYHILLEEPAWMVYLEDCIPNRLGCFGCKRNTWNVVHVDGLNGNHIGKRFIRTSYIEWEQPLGYPYYRQTGQNEFKFGNYIDFHNANLMLEEDLKTQIRDSQCRELFYSPLFVTQIGIKYANVHQFLLDTKEMYYRIFLDCAENHDSPTAFYHLALHAIYNGDYESGLDRLQSLFGKVKFDTLDSNMASELYESIGSVENEVSLYDSAISNLSKAIQANPKNKNAYFERAAAYFEIGEFDRSLEDFLNCEIDLSIKPHIDDGYLYDYAKSIPIGVYRGINDASAEFLPTICSSIRGIGNLLWTTIGHPFDSSKYFASQVLEFYQMLRDDPSQLTEMLVPEMHDLIENWTKWNYKKRGEQMGYCLGKYGTDIFLPIASVKGAKYVLTYNKIKKAEKICNLKTLALSKESKEALESTAARWNAQRLAWLEKVEIEVDKQSKHIRGSHNFDISKSEWTHPDPQGILKKYAGKGQKVAGTAGEAGYRERINCEEVIGLYNNQTDKIPTKMAIIHYSKKGAHLVPAEPK